METPVDGAGCAAAFLDLGRLFSVEPDLIQHVAQFADVHSLSQLSKTCRACAKSCQPMLEERKKLLKLQPRKDGCCRYHFRDRPNMLQDERIYPGKGQPVDASVFQEVLGEEISDLHAYDILQVLDYRGCGSFLVFPKDNRLLMKPIGGEFGYCLPEEAYAVHEVHGLSNYFHPVIASYGFIRYAHVPSTSDLFAKFAAYRPNKKLALFLSFEGDDPFEYDGQPDEDEDPDAAPLFWSLVGNFWWSEEDEEDEEDVDADEEDDGA